jgi:hypothetical protein
MKKLNLPATDFATYVLNAVRYLLRYLLMRRRTVGRRPAGPRPRGRCASRSSDPGPAGLSGRKTSGAPGRRPRRPFFPPALQGDDPRVRVPEQPVDRAPRAEARKAVCIPEVAVFWHPKVMPDFSRGCNHETPCGTRMFGDSALDLTHTIWRRPSFLNGAFRLGACAHGRGYPDCLSWFREYPSGSVPHDRLC